MLTCGCVARNELSASGRNSVSALVLDRVLQEGAAGLGRGHALASAHQQGGAQRLLHVADAGRCRRQREVCARRSVGDAAGIHHMAEQTEIGEVEAQCLLPSIFTTRNCHCLLLKLE
jgi:hypothetical protein